MRQQHRVPFLSPCLFLCLVPYLYLRRGPENRPSHVHVENRVAYGSRLKKKVHIYEPKKDNQPIPFFMVAFIDRVYTASPR